MLQNIVNNEKFKELMHKHCQDIIMFLFDENIEFSILTTLSSVKFDPILPEHITADFKPITLFTLAGYTYESAKLEDDLLIFEAGFGRENIGSFVSIPLYSIIQIIIEDTPIFINISLPPKKSKPKNRDNQTSAKDGVKKSMEIFLSNPKNKELLKKRKKGD